MIKIQKLLLAVFLLLLYPAFIFSSASLTQEDQETITKKANEAFPKERYKDPIKRQKLIDAAIEKMTKHREILKTTYERVKNSQVQNTNISPPAATKLSPDNYEYYETQEERSDDIEQKDSIPTPKKITPKEIKTDTKKTIAKKYEEALTTTVKQADVDKNRPREESAQHGEQKIDLKTGIPYLYNANKKKWQTMQEFQSSAQVEQVKSWYSMLKELHKDFTLKVHDYCKIFQASCTESANKKPVSVDVDKYIALLENQGIIQTVEKKGRELLKRERGWKHFFIHNNNKYYLKFNKENKTVTFVGDKNKMEGGTLLLPDKKENQTLSTTFKEKLKNAIELSQDIKSKNLKLD